MDAAGFSNFLLSTYESGRTGRHLTQAAAKDAVSRCRRVERSLAINLDEELPLLESAESLVERVSGSVERFGIVGNEKTGMSSLVRATRLYTEFKRHSRQGDADEVG